jgi:hypothetical protein
MLELLVSLFGHTPKDSWTDPGKTSIPPCLTWGYPSLESVTVARRLLGKQMLIMSPLARRENMAIRYVCLGKVP